MACAISQLVVILAVFGKLTLTRLIWNWLLFNFFWTLTHFICLLLQTEAPDTRLWDEYSINNVYVFAACYGLILAVILKKPPSNTENFSAKP